MDVAASVAAENVSRWVSLGRLQGETDVHSRPTSTGDFSRGEIQEDVLSPLRLASAGWLTGWYVVTTKAQLSVIIALSACNDRQFTHGG